MSYANFANIYDTYCPMLYGIALKICHSKRKAEELLIITFKKLYQQNIVQERYPAYCITLIRLIIKKAKELYPANFKNNIRLKQFENTLFLNQLFCDPISLQDYCNEEYLTLQEARQIIRKELITLRKIE